MYAEAASILRRTGDFSGVFVGKGFEANNRNQLIQLHNCWLILLADSAADPRKPERVLVTFSNTFKADPKACILFMTSLCDALLGGLAETSDGYVTVPWLPLFKRTPIFREYLQFYRTKDPAILQYIISVLWYGKKCEFDDPELIPNAFRKWDEIETGMREVFDRTLYINILKEVFASFFPSFLSTTMLPVHGSGVVAERGIGRNLELKNSSISSDPRIARAMFKRFGMEPTQVFPKWDTEITPSQTHSKLFFVRKNFKTARSICFEPILFMMAQQAVRLLAQEAIKEGLFRHHIFIDDQTVNRLAAQYGSETRRVDTIDLSSASDSVSWGLIKAIVPTKVRYYLQATRTRVVELPDGQLRPLKKFAPMGSALCFPVQCLVYASIVVSASILWGIKVGRLKPGYSNPVGAYEKLYSRALGESVTKLEPFYIYGDDIVCDSRITPIVYDMLDALGFFVNREKSFIAGSPFRESCGGFYFNGADVTPLLYRIPLLEGKVTASYLAALTDHCNLVGNYGFRNLHTYLIRYTLGIDISGVPKRNKKNPIMFTDSATPPPFTLFSKNPINEHLSFKVPNDETRSHSVSCDCKECGAKWNAYQRSYVKALVPIVTERVTSTFDSYHFTQWQRSKYPSTKKADLGITEAFGRKIPLEAGIGWGWMPA